jgi:hypothetical protein
MVRINEESLRRSAKLKEEKWPSKVNPEHKAVIEEAGAIYEPGLLGDLVLFTSLQTGSTMAISISKLTVDEVKKHILESNARFGR